MNYLSVCSGIEAATVAWHDLRWKPIAYSEIEPFPSAVLKHHYPTVPNLGDMTKYKEWKLSEPIDILVGGTPCQSFSVAGLRKGLEDPRGNLCLTYVGILDKFRPKWCVWENVPGVLSSNGGRDFGSFLGALVELGYGFAYRVLDAQNFGVAQRRRRVFVVGCLGDWESAAKVLFESESLSGNIKQSREARKEVASFAESSFGNFRTDELSGVIKKCGGVAGGGSETLLVNETANCLQTTSNDYSRSDGFNMVVYENHPTDSRIKEVEVSPTVTRRWGTGGGNVPLTQTFCLQWSGVTSQNANGDGFKEEQSYTLNRVDVHGVAVTQPIVLDDQGGSVINTSQTGIVGTLKSQTHGHESSIISNMAVRRLTPVECERLQGFPDNYTDIKPNGKPTPNGPRYAAMGNSMAVPVMKWIGERIQMVDSKC